MKRKIFVSVCIVSLSVFLVSLIFIMGICYQYFSILQKEQLKNETELTAQGVALSGEDYFNGLDTENYRITWIDPEGNVLYDNEVNTKKMENHRQREEVREALDSGYGEAERYSSTLAVKQLYAAKRLSDGTVLRLSISQMAVWTLLFGFVQPILIVVIVALTLSFILASRLAKRIVDPINEIDIENPEQYYGKESYKEIEPLLRHISAQRLQLKKDQEEIERTSLIRQEFTANASHELKTPLHAISGYAELLEKGMVRDEDIKPFAGKIHDESQRMTKLVDDIIDLSELDNGGPEMQWEECDLYRIAENAIDSLDIAASEKNITFELKGSKASMIGIPQLLYSIVYNLCDNAIKYNHENGNVIVSVMRVQDNNVLKVRDDGIGISKEDQERIFERFYRVDKSHSKEVGGTGLGLSIVKHAVMIHKGKIEVKSTQGAGTEFTVTLPVSEKGN